MSSLEAGQWVIICGLKHHTHLNGTYGLTTRCADGRWGVKVSQMGRVVSVRPDNLQKSKPPELRERSMLQMLLVKLMVDPSLQWVPQLVWSFLRDPFEFAIVSTPLRRTTFSLGGIPTIVEDEASLPPVQVLSVQTARPVMCASPIDIGFAAKETKSLLLTFLQGPAFAIGAAVGRTLDGKHLWWTKSGTHWEPTIGAAPDEDFFHAHSHASWPITSFPAGQEQRGPGTFICLVVCSPEAGFLFEWRSTGTCAAYNLENGEFLGSCAALQIKVDQQFPFSGTDARAACAVANGSIVLLSGLTCLQAVHVRKISLDAGDTEVVALPLLEIQRCGGCSSSFLNMAHGNFSHHFAPVALHAERCAFIASTGLGHHNGGGGHVNVHKISETGIESEPIVSFSPGEGKSTFAVALSFDKLISIEGKCLMSQIAQSAPCLTKAMTQCSVIVRDVHQPYAPPLFRLPLQEDCFHQVAICRIGVASDLKDRILQHEKRPPQPAGDTEHKFQSPEDQFEEILSFVRRRMDESPVARIAPAEAEEIVREQWVSHVERSVQDMQEGTAPASSTGRTLAVVLTFSRHPRCLDTALLQSGPGQRATAAGVNIKPTWANGAKILVAGLMEDTWKQAALDCQMSSYHAVVHSQDVDEILEALRKHPYHQRPRLKSGVVAAHVPDPEQIACLQDVSSASSDSKLTQCSTEKASDPSFAFWADRASSSTKSETDLALTKWLEAVKDVVLAARPVYLNTSNTFIQIPGSPALIPRSDYTESAPEQEGAAKVSNPRIWGTPRH